MNLTIENGKFMLRFPYDTAMVTKIKTLNCGTFNKVYKAWEFPLTAVAYRKIKTLGICHPEVNKWLNGRRKTIDLSKCQFKTECLPHQLEALKFTLTMFGMEVK